MEEDGSGKKNLRSEDDRDEQEFSAILDGIMRSKHWVDRDDELMDYTADLVWGWRSAGPEGSKII